MNILPKDPHHQKLYRAHFIWPSAPTRLQVYQSGVVYDGFRPDTGQDPAEMKKTIPSL